MDTSMIHADLVDPFDIAHGLALTCRFGGQCRTFYSMAEHSVRVMRQVQRIRDTPSPNAKHSWLQQALLYDAVTVYMVSIADLLGDQPNPLSFFEEYETAILDAITLRFKLDHSLNDLYPEVHNAALMLLLTEQRDLFDHEMWGSVTPAKRLERRIVPWHAELAEAVFLREMLRMGLIEREIAEVAEGRIQELWPTYSGLNRALCPRCGSESLVWDDHEADCAMCAVRCGLAQL